MSHTLHPTSPRWLGLMLLAVVLPLFGSDEAATPKPSSYAPAGELANQLEVLVKQVAGELANETDYDDEAKQRVARDANTLVVLAQVLANHDEVHPLRGAAPEIMGASRTLVSAAGQHASATSALAAVQASFQSNRGGQVKWESAAELAQLMKQVPILNNRLRLGVTGKRFDRLVDQNAGLATALAAIAQVSMYDTAYCTSKEDESTWARYCREMRTAASEIRVAIRKSDPDSARAGLDKLTQACDACHRDFRD